ncbi:MAG: PhzF family phenazine biosynthesis protein [Flavobacteriales bacterium]|nr:PhzF family phenazine biosynthesis protein [Flavobacteriales bacterium]
MNKKKQKMYQIDAFSADVFGGNPAAVCVLEEWWADEIMQHVASENNLSETAFVVQREKDFEIRWFTPTNEEALCGHATLASAHVIFNYCDYTDDTISFYSRHSGNLSVTKQKDVLTLNFPADKLTKVEAPKEINDAFVQKPLEVYKGKMDYLLLYASQEDIEQSDPNLHILRAVKARGVIITAKGKDVDFVSRFFAPGCGVEEDPVTGSAHTTLTPFWSGRLSKTRLTAQQLSQRKGDLICEIVGERVKISGNAVTYFIGDIYI